MLTNQVIENRGKAGQSQEDESINKLDMEVRPEHIQEGQAPDRFVAATLSKPQDDMERDREK